MALELESPDDPAPAGDGHSLDELARAIAGDADEAEEILQEAWLVRLRQRKGPDRPKAWWSAVLRNLATARGRKRSRRRRNEPRSGPATAPAAADLALRRETEERLRTLVASLPAAQREVLRLRFFEGLTGEEIAKRLGVKAVTVRSRLKRGLDELRERLGKGTTPEWQAPLAILLARPGAARGRPRLPWRRGPAAAAAGILLVAGTVTVFLFPGSGSAGSGPPAAGAATAAAEERRAADPAGGPAMAAAPFDPAAHAAITGRIVDPEGRPVPGARVVLVSHHLERAVAAADAGRAGSLTRTATTDAAGTFEVAPVPGSRFHDLVVDSAPHAPALREAVVPGDTLEVKLAPGRAIEGTVGGPGGARVSGASIRWETVLSGILVEREARSAADGSFRLPTRDAAAPETDPGSTPPEWIDARAAGLAPARWRGSLRDARTTGLRLEIVLGRGCRVSGSLRDVWSSESIENADVVLWMQDRTRPVPGPAGRALDEPRAPWGLDPVRSGPGGAFAFEHVPYPGATVPVAGLEAVGTSVVWIGAMPEGRPAWYRSVVLPADGAEATAELPVLAATRVEGRILFADLAPAPGFTIGIVHAIEDDFLLPPGTAADMVCFEVVSGGLGCVSAVRRFVVP